MRRGWFALLVAVSAVGCVAQSVTPAGSPAEVSFAFERPGLAVPKFSLIVREDGKGSYKGETASVSNGSYSSNAVSAGGGPKIDREIRLSPATTDLIFKTARSLNYFNTPCESRAKNIANTGKKTLAYTGADGHGACLYNYSDNKSVTQLTETFQAIAFTLDEGRKLDFLHRFDRLGLYAEMDTLRREVEAKRALELGNISKSLTSIANDEALMQRVRERAAALLNEAGQDTK